MSQSEPSVLLDRIANQSKSTPGRWQLELANSNSALRFVWNSKCGLTLGVKVIHKKHQSKQACMPARTLIHTHTHRSPAICLSVLSSLFAHIREGSLRDRIWGLGLALLRCSYTPLNGSHLFSHRGWLIHVSCARVVRCQNNSSG